MVKNLFLKSFFLMISSLTKCCITTALSNVHCCNKHTYKIISRKYFVLFFFLVTTHSQDFPKQGKGFKEMLDFLDSLNDSESDQRSVGDFTQMTVEKVSKTF